MDISPQRVRTAEFKTVKKGLDPDEVRAFLVEVAGELERAQNQSTAMEARARAAVARLQELSEATPEPEPEPEPEPVAEVDTADEVAPTVDQAETISRTLLLAQRTADNAIAEAEAEAARLRAEAEDEATRTLDSTREMSARLIDEARDEARRSGEAARIQIESEVNALLARRDFLESDVDHLETFLVDERSRLRDAASSLLELVERVPAGLGEVRRPLLSASDDQLDASSGDVDRDDDLDDSGPVEPVRLDLRGSREAEDATPAVETDEPGLEFDDDDGDDDDRSDDRDDRDDATQSGFGRFEPRRSESSSEPLIIQTDISDEGPTGFSYDDTNR